MTTMPTPPDGVYPNQTVDEMHGAPDVEVPDIALPDTDPDETNSEDVIA